MCWLVRTAVNAVARFLGSTSTHHRLVLGLGVMNATNLREASDAVVQSQQTNKETEI